MIFHDHRTIFFHVPRTGGTSVEHLFVGGPLHPAAVDRSRLWGLDEEEKMYLQHATCATTLRLVGRELFDAYFKFAIVRNPFTRAVSVYHYQLVGLQQRFGSFKGWLRALPELVEQPRAKKGSHVIPQHDFTHLDGRQVVDTVLRFEDLPGCMDVIRERLGIVAPLPDVNKSAYPELTRKPTAWHYDAEGVDLVRRVYADDFALFGYRDTLPGG